MNEHKTRIYKNKDLHIGERLNDLLRQMMLEEKIHEISTHHSGAPVFCGVV